MQIGIDPKSKTIKLYGNINFREFLEFLDILDVDPQDWTLIPDKEIVTVEKPVYITVEKHIIKEVQPYTNPWTNPWKLPEVWCGTNSYNVGMVVNSTVGK